MVSTEDFQYSKLSKREKVVYDWYKNDPYHLNDKLRKARPLINSEQSTVDDLETLISQYHCPKEIELYRGACDDCIEGFIQDSFYNNPAFMSTATDARSACSHVQCEGIRVVFFKIRCQRETAMIPMDKANSGHSENEMLLNRRSVFRINDDRIITDKVKMKSILPCMKANAYIDLGGIKEVREINMEFLRYEKDS